MFHFWVIVLYFTSSSCLVVFKGKMNHVTVIIIKRWNVKKNNSNENLLRINCVSTTKHSWLNIFSKNGIIKVLLFSIWPLKSQSAKSWYASVCIILEDKSFKPGNFAKLQNELHHSVLILATCILLGNFVSLPWSMKPRNISQTNQWRHEGFNRQHWVLTFHQLRSSEGW